MAEDLRRESPTNLRSSLVVAYVVSLVPDDAEATAVT
jgi:hypothetical protein